MDKTKDFTRAFCTAIIVTSLLLFLALAFVLVNEELAESGFSSGAVLTANFSEEGFLGEFMGQKFGFYFSDLEKTAEYIAPAAILLPPWVKLILRVLTI